MADGQPFNAGRPKTQIALKAEQVIVDCFKLEFADLRVDQDQRLLQLVDTNCRAGQRRIERTEKGVGLASG